MLDISSGIELTFEFCHDITIWKMTIFDEVYYIEIEAGLTNIDPLASILVGRAKVLTFLIIIFQSLSQSCSTLD